MTKDAILEFYGGNQAASFFSKPTNTQTAPAILTRISLKDKAAVRECVKTYGKMVWALAKQYTDSKAEAERIVPEIFTSGYGKLQKTLLHTY